MYVSCVCVGKKGERSAGKRGESISWYDTGEPGMPPQVIPVFIHNNVCDTLHTRYVEHFTVKLYYFVDIVCFLFTVSSSF